MKCSLLLSLQKLRRLADHVVHDRLRRYDLADKAQRPTDASQTTGVGDRAHHIAIVRAHDSRPVRSGRPRLLRHDEAHVHPDGLHAVDEVGR